MSNESHRSASALRRFSRTTNFLLVFLNISLVIAAFVMYALYNNAYKERLREENLSNIANMNRSAVVNTTALFESWNIKLNDISDYSHVHGLTAAEMLDYISESNSSDDRYFELIGSDYTGFLARKNSDGTYPALDYSHYSYSALQQIFDKEVDSSSDQISFAPEYTDAGIAAENHFTVYRNLMLKSESGEQERYTLMLAVDDTLVLARLNAQTDYVGQSTMLMDADGNYIVSDDHFKSSNFYQYLYKYNDLTLDQRREIEKRVRGSGSGELYYKNADVVVEDCLFRYERMEPNGWFCVTCVPLSSFHTPIMNNSYIIYTIVFLIMLFALDVICLQRINRRLRTSAAHERAANNSKSSFLSRMSHEIRTPLNAVIGYNTIAKNELNGATTDAQRKQIMMKILDYLSKSEIASKHLLTVINDVLDMSAIESGRIKIATERFDFRGLITSLTTVFYSQAKAKGIGFDVIFNTLTEEWFIGDQMRVNQILTNLLSNAVKFTPSGGSVVLKITQPDAETDASHIRFEISDTGIGMTEEYLGHLFTPFEQADSTISRRFGGSGLGLSITKNLVDLMGGKIKVESTLGAGTTFRVDLTFRRTEQPQSSTSYDFSSVNALVVDDDTNTCDYIRLLFNRCGAKCATVTSGEDALKAVSVAMERNDYYSVCLVDWRMPKMDGIETVQELRKIAGDKMPIVILTAYDYAELADQATTIGVDKFISKPLFQSSLFDLLVNICGMHADESVKSEMSVDFGGARVLLAEDNAMNMEIARTILSSAGLNVDCAWNGREAVDMFNASAPGDYKVILMDIHMPEMNGYEATQAIRKSEREDSESVLVIAMTADAFAEDVAEAQSFGMNGHISKPIDVPMLFKTLKKYI